MASWVRPHRVILAAIIVVSILLPGSQLLSEWESLSVFTIYGAQFNDLILGISPHANIGGQGYLLLEFSRPLIEYLNLPYTLDFIRLPVRILGAIGLIFFYVISRRWFGAWPALAGTALLAVNPMYHQYQNELIIAGPSLFVFIIFLERIQYLTRFAQRWWGWLSLAAVWTLLLTMYGPSRIFSTLILCLWIGWAIVRANRRLLQLNIWKLLFRTLVVSSVTVTLLVLATTSNIRKISPRLLIPPASESALVGGTQGGLWATIKTNAQIIFESLLSGGGAYHSSFMEATFIQGRYPIIPLIIVPLMLGGFIFAVLATWRLRERLANRYASILILGLLTSVPFLTSSIFTGPSGPSPTLVNYRLAFFLVPAYLAICALAASPWIHKRRRVIIATVLISALWVQGCYVITAGHERFLIRAETTDTTLVGPAAYSQWLEGYSLQGVGTDQPSHFQQHEQYDRWAEEVAREISTRNGSQVLIVPTAIDCFPEAPLQTRTLSELNGKNYHPVFLSLYLASRLGGIKTAYVNVPPKDLAPGYVMFETGLFPGPIMLRADGTYEYESAEPAGANLMEFGSGDLSVVITTTQLELETAMALLDMAGRDYQVQEGATPCW
ncbi:MAG: hypothetical protein JW384_00126 [Nitrosomonadaceae bacterium]|nr:hypothetical protein [Nitrosomonadaceae bacterium]